MFCKGNANADRIRQAQVRDSLTPGDAMPNPPGGDPPIPGPPLWAWDSGTRPRYTNTLKQPPPPSFLYGLTLTHPLYIGTPPVRSPNLLAIPKNLVLHSATFG